MARTLIPLLLLVAVSLSACGGGGDGDATPAETPTAPALGAASRPSLLFVDNRTHVSICVDGAGGLEITGADVDAVRQALERGFATLEDVPPEYADREVVMGCAPPAERLGAPQKERGVGVPNVDAAGKHRLHVYFVPASLYDATFFGRKPYTRSVEEFILEGDVRLPVTEGLYFPSTASEDAVRQGLLVQLGLVREERTPQPTIDWCACDRGEDPDPPLWTCHDPYVEEQCDDWRRKNPRE